MSNAPAFGRIAIWGVGLIGGSLGMTWRRAGVAREIIGIDDPAVLADAVRLGAVDRPGTPNEALQEADVLVLAAPVQAILDQAAKLAPEARSGLIITDTGSTKDAIVRAWEEHLPPGVSFVGGHPLFGREVSGVANASPDLPRGARYVLTPGSRATEAAVQAVAALAAAAGAVPAQMTPAEHDQRVAAISHLPQLVATALAAAALAEDDRLGGVLDLAAGGFRDTTRIAASPASLWTDILLTNPAAIRTALGAFREQLDQLERSVQTNDPEGIRAVFSRAHAARERLPRRD